MREVASALNVRWLDVAMQPVAPVGEMPWMPKARYGIMRRHLGARGRLAHRMMTQTASIQCAFDYESFEDWTRRFRAAALLAPVAVALFANSRRVEGADSGFRSFRQAIWRETDPDRSGIPPVVFRRDFGVETWIEWLLDIPTLFVHGPGETLEPAGGTPFRALMARQERNPISEKDWELHLSCVFTEVRSYDYIEVRSADLQPDSRIMAVPAFWTGLLYHPRALEAALDLTRSHDSHRLWADAMESASRHGLEGAAARRPLRELASRALSLARWGLAHGADCAGSSGASVDLLGVLAEQLSLPACDGELQAG
jgi:glutamate--cysteine ligase